ncbi:MAG: hypothetical protein R3D80_10475 [Paracoccaceae bacterium]
MSNNCVREALEWSVAKAAPAVRFHRSQASTVPIRNRPVWCRARASGRFSTIQASFGAGNIGLMARPVAAVTAGPWPAATSAAQISAVRVHCHRIAGPTGSPVSASQATMVSRWFEIASASMLSGPTSAATVSITERVAVQIPAADCSAQPGFG